MPDTTPTDADSGAPAQWSTAEWSSVGAHRWAANADRLEAQLHPVTPVLLDAAALRPGEHALDVGCGRGPTTREVARAVGPSGSVVGLDVAPELLAEARDLDVDGRVTWELGDAQTHPLPADRFDVVLSRFGVMFFDDPTVAFANLLRATAPGGRLCVAVWQTRDRSGIMDRPLQTAARAAAAAGHPIELPPPDVGPFALGDPDVVGSVLGGAGWADVSLDPHVIDMHLAGPGSVEEAVEVAMAMGALRVALDGAPDEAVAAVREALGSDLSPLHDGTGVALPGAIFVVTARRPR